MGMFSQYTKEGHGVSKEQANAPAYIQFFRILGTRFWTLICLNLLYILFCLPIITIGPATAGMTKVLRNWSRRDAAFVWGDFWETFKTNFKQSFFVGLINTVITSILIFDLLFFIFAVKTPIFVTCFVGFTILIWLYMNYYIYTMLITFRLNLRQLYKNAFIFAWAGFIRNTGITLIIVAISYLFTLFVQNPLVWVIYFSCYFGICGYTAVFITYPLIKRYMIDNVNPETGERLETEPTDD